MFHACTQSLDKKKLNLYVGPSIKHPNVWWL